MIIFIPEPVLLRKQFKFQRLHIARGLKPHRSLVLVKRVNLELL